MGKYIAESVRCPSEAPQSYEESKLILHDSQTENRTGDRKEWRNFTSENSSIQHKFMW